MKGSGLHPLLGVCGRRRGHNTFLAFGGTADDKLSCVRVLANGDYAVAGITYSQSFCGYDLSSYTDGSTYPCYFIMIIDKTLPPTGFIKGHYWYSGASDKTIGGKNRAYPKIAVIQRSGVDKIVFFEGTYKAWGGAVATDWKRQILDVATMSIETTQTGYNVHNSYAYAIGSDGTYFRSIYFNAGYGFGIRTALSDLAEVGASTTVSVPTGGCLSGTDLYWISYYNTPEYVTKVTQGNVLSNVDFDAVFAASYRSNVLGVGSNLLIVDKKQGSTNTTLFTLRTKANLANKPAGWTDYELSSPAVDTYQFIELYYDSESGNILALYMTIDGSVGATDMRLLVLNASTGAAVRNVPITYPSGAELGVATKNFSHNKCEIVKIATNKYLISGIADVEITGLPYVGGYDSFMMLINDEGKMI